MIIPSETDARFKFKIGDTAYTRGRRQVTIKQQLLHLSERGAYCPHYLAVDADGIQWQISQLELSRKAMEKLGR